MAGLKHLKPSNSYYEVIVPFVAYVTKSFEPSNSYYGSSQLYAPTRVEYPLKKGDQIHNLHGGIFVVRNGETVGYSVSPSNEKLKHPFEKSGEQDIPMWPLDKLSQIEQAKAFKANYKRSLKD